jgi:hypothetical protein
VTRHFSARRRLPWWLLPPLALAFAPACRPPCPPEPPPVVVREYVAVPPPAPAVPPRPALPSAALPDEPALADLIKALLADRELLAAWALDLEAALAAYLPGADNGSEDPR